MKRLTLVILCLTFFICASQTAFAQFTLTIEINQLENNTGQVILEFCNEKGEKISGYIQSIENNKSIILINDLKPGSYSFKYFHDENQNKKLDVNWIGMPKEGFGFSNDATGTFGPPDLEKTVFTIKGNQKLTCKPKYF
jgi:uncharacterized protein (DUF2141 family)